MIKDMNYDAPAADINRWRTLSLGIGGILSIIILVVALVFPSQREDALRAWLLGFIFWGGIGIGGLGVLILQYLTGGAWGIVIRRIAEAASRTLPIIFALFLPVMFGITYIYEWTHLLTVVTPDGKIADKIIEWKQPYLSIEWFIIRAVLYFILWGVMAALLNRWSAAQDKTNDYDTAFKMQEDASKFSGPTMVFYVVVVSFAAIDWVMTLDPHWFSTIWGLLFAVSWALSFFCFAVAILAVLADKAPFNRVLGKRHFHDIGKLMLALVMVWAYFNFSQFLIIWSGNLPEETRWYLTRMEGVWGAIGIILIILHFAFPFLVLLNRDIKRNSKYLAIMAGFILLLRIVDIYYQIGPSPRVGGHIDGFHISIWDFVAPFAVGGIWLWYFFGELLKRPLLPVNDPYLDNAIKHGKEH